MPPTPAQPKLTPQLILRNVRVEPGKGRLHDRLLRLCDGQRTVLDVAREARLPYLLCSYVLSHALRQQWLEVRHQPPNMPTRPIQNAEEFWQQLKQYVVDILGPAGECVLERATLMIRVRPHRLTQRDAHHLLIAVELTASEWERDRLLPALDALRGRYPYQPAPTLSA